MIFISTLLLLYLLVRLQVEYFFIAITTSSTLNHRWDYNRVPSVGEIFCLRNT